MKPFTIPIRLPLRPIAVLSACVILSATLTACDGVSTLPPVQQPTGAPDAPTVPEQAPLPADTSIPPTPAPTEEPAVVIINGERIPLSALERRVQLHEAELIAQGLDPNSAEGQTQLQQIRQEVLDGMIDTVLVEQEAQRKGIAVSDEALAAELQAIVDESGGTDAFNAYLSANALAEEEFRAGLREAMLTSLMRDTVIANVSAVVPQTHARHILVDNADLANSLLAQLLAGADFASLAQQYSQDLLTRDGGGDLDWFPRGGLILKEVEDAAFALEPGQYSGVVQSPFGYHIIQVVERENARPLSENQLLAFQQNAYQDWINSLRSASNIETLQP